MSKTNPIRDSKWLKQVSDMACVATGADHQPCDPAHIRAGGSAGMGIKPSDDLVLPLSHEAHMRQHQIGEKAFWFEVLSKDRAFMMECVKAYARQLYRAHRL